MTDRSRHLLAALSAGAVLLSPAAPRAGLYKSPHDLVSQGYDIAKTGDSRERCLPCHLPLGPDGRNFLSLIPPSLSGYDRGSLNCFSCHDGTTLVNPWVDATATAFRDRSHGNDAGAVMSCLECHLPHDNSSRPFLKKPIASLCKECHDDLFPAVKEGVPLRKNHPLGIDPLELPRTDVPVTVDPALRVDFPGIYPPAGGKLRGGIHWDLGAHLSEGGKGGVLCVTCHVVHGDEETPPLEHLLAVDPVREQADLLCESCHRGVRGDGVTSPLRPNPGGTVSARTYHPCDDDIGNGPGEILAAPPPPEWPTGSLPPGTLLCSTCHTPHGGRTGTALLRPAVASSSFCEECHRTMPLVYHHGLTVNAESGCGKNLPAPAYGGVRTGVECGDCHRAHNAGFGKENESDYVPILREPPYSAEGCAVCHDPRDPTCGGNPGQMASHFIGDPTLAETYADPLPPLRTAPWPESGLLSVYGGATGQAVTCLSCHTFRPGYVTSGDEGKTPHLLARSGTSMEWEEGGEGFYLCPGCHTANPGTAGSGHTHPLMTADMTVLGRVPEPPVTVTPNQRINCDSCHRPHEATTSSGYYILEVIRSANTDPQAIQPVVDFSGLCHKCHDADEY